MKLASISHLIQSNYYTLHFNRRHKQLNYFPSEKNPLFSAFLHSFCNICLFSTTLIIHSLIMKVKFLSKKERETIKAQKELNNNHPSSNENPQQSTRTADFAAQSSRQPNSTQGQAKLTPAHHNHSYVPFSEHLLNQDEDNNFEAERQRSRDNKYKEITKEELEERAKMKKKLLGLEKIQQSQRRNPQYRNQLLFEWSKAEDTSQGFVPIVPQEKTWAKRKDFLEKEEFETWKTKPFEKMEERDWRIFREDHQIYIRGGKAPNPIRDWKEVPEVSQVLLQNLEKINFEKPKPIQMQAIPIGMMQKDLMAIAPTGEGKTLAYLFPIIHFLLPLERMNMNNFDHGPYALVLVPTRELAEQIDEEFQKFTRGMGLTTFVAVGGRQFELQALELSKGCDLLIATPGRVKEFIEKHHLTLQRLSWCVVDQADKMVSENLSEDLEFILESGGEHSLMGGRKVIHMFSATMIPEVEKLGRSYLSASYTYITIGEPGGGKKDIDQSVDLMDENSKPDRLAKILRALNGPLIVFVNSREKCEKISLLIQKRTDRSVAEYHGGKNQEQRQKVISMLKSGKVEILVATDLAGRGLDVKGINAVINYDAPKNISEFVHRSGRTGRAGMKGKAFTFLTADDEGIFYDLRTFLERNQFTVPPSLKEHPASMVRPGGVVHVKRAKQIVYTN